MNDNRKIGIIDSGVGGLTVVKEFKQLLPGENIIYIGDNKNIPYGNKTEGEIYELTKKMIELLIKNDVKLIAVACNTISSIVDKYFSNCKIPVISIIEPVTTYVVAEGFKEMGIMATRFTIESKAYENSLKGKNDNIDVVSESCPNLATIIDGGDYTEDEIHKDISLHMANILRKKRLKDIILGCTHYPIVLYKFKEVSPYINFINPAYHQVIYVKSLMEKNSINGDTKRSSFEIYTTGKKEMYLETLETLDMEMPDTIKKIII